MSEQDAGQVPRPHLFTLSEAAAACGVSRSRIRRLLDADAFPNAVQEEQPGKGTSARVWRIPAPDLLAVGLVPNRSADSPADRPEAAGNLSEAQGGQVPGQELEQLRGDLDRERERRQAAEALAAERGQALDDLRLALRLLEAANPGGPGPLPQDPEARTGAPTSSPVEDTPQATPQAASSWWGKLRGRMR